MEFAVAAFIAWMLTVTNAINKAILPANKNIHQFKFILYAKPSSHLFMKKYPTGHAITLAISTDIKNSFDNNVNSD